MSLLNVQSSDAHQDRSILQWVEWIDHFYVQYVHTALDERWNGYVMFREVQTLGIRDSLIWVHVGDISRLARQPHAIYRTMGLCLYDQRDGKLHVLSRMHLKVRRRVDDGL